MKKTLWIAAVSLLLAGSACKKDENRTDLDQDMTGNVPAQTQRGEMREDLAVNPDLDRDRDRDMTADTERDDSAAFKADLRARLDRLDARIAELEARADQESKDAAATLRQRRDELATKLDRAEDKAGSTWDEFKADVNRSYEELERDLDRAFE